MSDSALPPQYDPSQAEAKWYPVWEKAGYFAPAGDGEPYTIVLPPPNVTGALHMGHALTATLQDTLIRYHRMRGRRTLWVPGTDHAGIATQMVVERELAAKEGKTRYDLGREKFLERVWAWKETTSGRIQQQHRVLGCSLDWSRERFTMDEPLQVAVREVFVRLFEEGLIYRTERLINWDPKGHTALSDLEVEHEDVEGELYEFAYPYANGQGELVVATTRPETMLGDTAVAVHPDDPRYKDVIGKTLRHPILGYELPVVGDAELVDPEFGTGAVKVTPAHDFNDFETGKRHHLVLFNIFDRDAKVLHQPELKAPTGGGEGPMTVADIEGKIDVGAWKRYAGLDRFVARKQVKAELQELGLERGTKKHAMALGRSQRTGVVVEPYLSVQWFVKAEPLAKPALEAVRSGATRIIPEGWTKTYYHWMENIQDWCVSRQLWWGHQIPAWYVVDEAHDPNSPVPASAVPIVSRERPDPAEHCKPGQKLVQDPDVLDTWFSSGLWPFSTLGWPEQTDDLRRYYPNTVMETGFDILFFWVARMMMMGCKLMGQPPFATVYLHAMVRDKHGDKMSKTKGNVIDPLSLVHGCKPEEVGDQFKSEYPEGFPAFGADALRFTLAAMSASGRDIKLSVERIAGYRAFANKIWNAARFALMRLEGVTPRELGEVKADLQPADRFILSRLAAAANDVNQAIEGFRFADAAQSIYSFFWDEFCDWYIELVKPRLTGDDARSKEAAGATLVFVLDQALRLLHPMMPFITEEIWQRLPMPDRARQALPTSIMLAPFPRDLANAWHDPQVESTYARVKDAIVGIRTIRAESNVSPSKPVHALIAVPDAADRQALENHAADIRALARVEDLTIAATLDKPAQSAVKVLERMEVVVPLAGLVDLAEETGRLRKSLEKTRKEHEKLHAKLQNKAFVDRAPADVVAKDRARLQELEEMIKKLEESLERLK